MIFIKENIMKYTKKDLKAVDAFALFFILAGGLVLVSGILLSVSGSSPGGPGKVGLGAVFLCLGTALNLGLRQVIVNKGEDVKDSIDEIGE